mmetsp:Transcript_121122/g.210347  ORF Transcript_121122/g.210347 Transcript_121122/m.210347 type:complete len:245 (+) Transcript_121122:28-762(+)
MEPAYTCSQFSSRASLSSRHLPCQRWKRSVSTHPAWLVIVCILGSAIGAEARGPVVETPLRASHEATARRLVPWKGRGETQVNCSVTPCGDHGSCQNDFCVCEEKFYTLDHKAPCGEQKRSRMVGILLHVFFCAVGGGPFYMGWNSYGWLMVILCVLPCLCFLFGGIYVRLYVRIPKSRDPKKHVIEEDPNPGRFHGPDHLSGSERFVTTCAFCLCLGGLIVWIVIILWLVDKEARDSHGMPIV